MKKIIFIFISGIILFFNQKGINANTSTFTKYIGNPIISPNPNSWDEQATTTKAVIYESGIFKMWYAGSRNNTLQIGYATSIDGINWIKYENNPVLPSDTQEKNLYAPTVIKDNNTYKMWYTTVNESQIYEIRHATSNDGINWIKHGSININNHPLNVKLEPYVLKIGNEYKMWYTSNNGKWVINYATSSDGINWNQYPGNPVLIGDQPWEGNDVAQPAVIFDGSIYEIFYHGSNVSYAISYDGINWIKQQEKNPVLTSGGTDPGNIIDPNPVRLVNNTIMLYYTRFGDGIKIGLAYNGPIGTPTPTPSPSPSPSPTQSPSPTPSPAPSPTTTPMPTPAPVTKAIIIPGFGASWNRDALLECKSENYAGSWTLNDLAEDIYRPIQTSLSNQNITPILFAYDWRKDVRETAEALRQFINANTSENERAHLIGHSMGGLVARAYLEQTMNNNKVGSLVTVGSPHQGVASAYAAWSGGEIWSNDLLFRIYLSLLMKRCQLKQRIPVAKDAVQQFAPSIKNMLPTYNYLINHQTNQIIPVHTMADQNNWLPNNAFNAPFYSVTVGSVAGSGFQTIESIRVTRRNSIDILLGRWKDGRPVRRVYTNHGDGTVLAQSSSIAGANHQTLQKNHTDIIKSQEGVNAIMALLGAQTSSPQTFYMAPEYQDSEHQSALVILNEQGDVSLIEETNQPRRGKDPSLLIIVNPKNKEYTMRFFSRHNTSRILVGQFLPEDTIVWNEYAIRGSGTKRATFKFRMEHPSQNRLFVE